MLALAEAHNFQRRESEVNRISFMASTLAVAALCTAGSALAREIGLCYAAVAMVVLLLAIAPIASTVYSTVVVRATRALTGAGDTSSFLRVQGNWKMTYYLLETSPVVGVGLGNFYSEYLKTYKLKGTKLKWAGEHAHNLYLHVAAETGIPADHLERQTVEPGLDEIVTVEKRDELARRQIKGVREEDDPGIAEKDRPPLRLDLLGKPDK